MRGYGSWENRSPLWSRIGSLRALVEQQLEYGSDFGLPPMRRDWRARCGLEGRAPDGTLAATKSA